MRKIFFPFPVTAIDYCGVSRPCHTMNDIIKLAEEKLEHTNYGEAKRFLTDIAAAEAAASKAVQHLPPKKAAEMTTKDETETKAPAAKKPAAAPKAAATAASKKKPAPKAKGKGK